LLAPLSWWAWTTLAAAAGLRAAVAIKVGIGVVHDRALWRHLWLLPIRDLIAFAVWFASFADHTVHWRGEVFILENGKIRPAHPREPEHVSAAKPDQDKVSVHS
jgi:ceramide glucosyltransferase